MRRLACVLCGLLGGLLVPLSFPAFVTEPLAQGALPGSSLDIPVDTWVARPLPPKFPDSPGAPSKHVQLAYDTDRHVVYLYGGDYCVFEPALGSDRCSSHEEVWSYDAARDKWALLLDQRAAMQPGWPKGSCQASFASFLPASIMPRIRS